MYPSLSIILSVLLPYCTVFSAAASVDCFKQERDSYTTTANTTSRISAPVACPKAENKTCQLTSGGFMNAPSTLNINTTHTTELFDAIGKAVKTEFKESIYGAVPNVTFTVDPGQTGYIGFTVTLRCYDGVIEGANCFDDVPAGVSITACQPGSLSGDTSQGVPNLDGTAAFVNTDRETAFNTTNNPAATAKPNANSGAVKVLGQGGWWSTMMMTAAVTAMGIGSCFVAF